MAKGSAKKAVKRKVKVSPEGIVFIQASFNNIIISITNKQGEQRACTSCHGMDPRQSGQHATTKKPIKPMAMSVNSARFSDEKKINKWFTRNCKWTWGRECSPQEKGDILQYMLTL